MNTDKETKQLIDGLIELISTNSVEYYSRDAVEIPRLYTKRQDIEIAALIAPMGMKRSNPTEGITTIKKLFVDTMNNEPFAFVTNEEYKLIDPHEVIYNDFTNADLIYMCRGFNTFYSRQSTLEVLFFNKSPWEGIKALRETFASANNGKFSKHIPDPSIDACGCIHKALRWLCRKDKVDIGIWNSIQQQDLMIPLDNDNASIWIEAGFINDEPINRSTVEYLTEQLRRLDDSDPSKYDMLLYCATGKNKYNE